MTQLDRDARSLWEDQARSDLATRSDVIDQVDYRARNILGAVLLFLAKPGIYTYTVADAPKLDWLSRSLIGTGEHVLDIGVRTGAGARFFQEHGKLVWGIDIAQAYVDHCLTAGYIQGGAVCNIETDDIPTPAAYGAGLPTSYDIVFLSEVIEHLLDGKNALQKLAQIIRPGGCLILTTPNLAYLANRIRLLCGRDLDTLTMDRGVVGNQHIRVFTAQLLKRLCREAGLEVDMVGSDGVPINLARLVDVVPKHDAVTALPDNPALITLPGTSILAPTLGRSIYVRARKLPGH